MAISVLQWVWDHSRSRHGARLVLLAIADCARTDGGAAWPSVAELSRKCGLKERAVRAAITDLAALGELAVEYNAGPKGCNRYRVITTTPAKSAPLHYLQGSDSAHPHTLDSAQVSGQTPADNAPPAKSAPLQISTLTPAKSAPGTVRDPSSTSKTPRQKRDLNEGRDDIWRLCTHLADRIERNAGERPLIGKRWLDAARLMLDNDHRTEQQVHKAIDWCQDSPFWWKNVMSMPKLREQYVRLRAEAQAGPKGSPNGAKGDSGHVSPHQEHMRRR